MTKAQEAFESVSNQEDHDFLTTFSFISMLCFDVYMRKHMIEKMIDDCLMGDSFSGNKGEVKRAEPRKENTKSVNKPEKKVAKTETVKKNS